jgi:DNA-3-methyladenine glycosylase
MKILDRNFFQKSADILARDLLGKILIHKIDNKLVGGIIVETEAYLQDDPASHSFKGQTNRNKAMFLEGGFSYVYKIYGFHFCFNVVSGEKNVGEAVLIRSLEPLYNIDIMKMNRKTENIYHLTNGPSKLCQALNININHNSICLYNSNVLFILENKSTDEITITKRIGISKGIDLPLRFYLRNNKFVSKK